MRFLADSGEFAEGGLVDVLGELGGDAAREGGSGAAQLVSAAQEELSDRREAISAFHHHIAAAHSGRGGSAKGLITFLIVLHLLCIAYWALIWLRQRRQRPDARQRTGGTPKVGCTYDWTEKLPQKIPVLPKIPNIQLAPLGKSAQH